MTFRTEWDNDPNPVYDIWTSVNGSEVLPGIVSPLVASAFDAFEYEALCALRDPYPAGAAVELFDSPTANFMGVFGGRLALNNGLSVALMSTIDPSIAQAVLQQFFTGAGGGERFVLDVSDELREATFAVATAQREAAPAKLVEDHMRLMGERRSGRGSLDLGLDLRGAWDRFVDVVRESSVDLLVEHLVVSGAAGEYQVRLGGVLDAAGLDPNAVVPLCSGLGDVESSKPALALYDLAQLAAAHPTVGASIASGDPAVPGNLAEPPDRDWEVVATAFDEFLVQWGFRVQSETDFTKPDWSEQPDFAISQVRSMMALAPDQAPRAAIERAQENREGLEQHLRAALSTEFRAPFAEMLEKAQHYTRLRELSKAVWVLGMRRARPPYLALARELAEAGVVDEAGDAEYLMFDEIAAIVGGNAVADARERVARRRAQAQEASGYRLPDNWMGDPVPEPIIIGEQQESFVGLGVSAGRGPVTGAARVVDSASAGLARDIEPGDVLVAPHTDAPWTPLFVVAGAVVVETGGVLSHAATVARELDIPAVVMVKGATTSIADGDTVTVDGAAGTVTVTARATR